jgi:hypothetical protein
MATTAGVVLLLAGFTVACRNDSGSSGTGAAGSANPTFVDPAAPDPATPPSAAASPSAAVSPSPSFGPKPKWTCFPYPAHNPAKGPHPVIHNEGPPLGKKYLDLADRWFKQEWPGMWQTFAPPDMLNRARTGINTVYIQGDKSGTGFGSGVVRLYYQDLMKIADDGGDTGVWTHEHAHIIQDYPHVDGYKYPGLFKEGITDFIRFVAHSEDTRWKLVSVNSDGFWNEQTVWNQGYGFGARFLLWVTQHYDNTGNRYRLVHDLNAAVHQGDRNYDAWFRKRTGKTYHQLFADYLRNRSIRPHC